MPPRRARQSGPHGTDGQTESLEGRVQNLTRSVHTGFAWGGPYTTDGKVHAPSVSAGLVVVVRDSGHSADKQPGKVAVNVLKIV